MESDSSDSEDEGVPEPEEAKGGDGWESMEED